MQGVGRKSLLALFGFNAKGLPRVQLQHPELPFFFNASLQNGACIGEKSEVHQNMQKAIAALNVDHTRNIVLTWDDTVYWPTYALVYFPEPHVVGGAGKHAALKLKHDRNVEEVMGGLEKRNLAQVALSYVLSRADSNRHAYDVLMRPRRVKDMSSEPLVQEVARVWQTATDANHGLPPLASSCDNHSSQVIISRLFAGLEEKLMMSVPFLGLLGSLMIFTPKFSNTFGCIYEIWFFCSYVQPCTWVSTWYPPQLIRITD